MAEKSFLLTKTELELIVLALEDKIEIFEQIVIDEPEEKEFLAEMKELCADLKDEWEHYDMDITERLKWFKPKKLKDL